MGVFSNNFWQNLTNLSSTGFAIGNDLMTGFGQAAMQYAPEYLKQQIDFQAPTPGPTMSSDPRISTKDGIEIPDMQYPLKMNLTTIIIIGILGIGAIYILKR